MVSLYIFVSVYKMEALEGLLCVEKLKYCQKMSLLLVLLRNPCRFVQLSD